MPSFSPERLPDDVLRHVLTYLETPAEAEPPPPPEPQGRGLNFEVRDAIAGPGERPVVNFRIRDKAGAPIAPAEMTALNLTVGGPTVDYGWARREDARRAEMQPDGWARYTFAGSLPADAAGTYAVATEGYVESPSASPGAAPVRDTGFNVVAYFAVTDPVPVPPRQIVQISNCNACHGTLATHGGTRRNTDFCVMCHNATQTDEEKRRVAGGPLPPEPVLFRNLIHRIHTGEDLAHPFVIYGGSPANPAPVDLAAVHPFPKDRANCAVCHEAGTQAITAALEQRAPMVITSGGETIRQVPPITAACTGCHDSDRTLAHVASETSGTGVETCAVCHGQGRPFSVTSVHRSVPPRLTPGSQGN